MVRELYGENVGVWYEKCMGRMLDMSKASFGDLGLLRGYVTGHEYTCVLDNLNRDRAQLCPLCHDKGWRYNNMQRLDET
eukprot:767237-Hanusia_phi.AAC.1